MLTNNRPLLDPPAEAEEELEAQRNQGLEESTEQNAQIAEENEVTRDYNPTLSELHSTPTAAEVSFFVNSLLNEIPISRLMRNSQQTVEPSEPATKTAPEVEPPILMLNAGPTEKTKFNGDRQIRPAVPVPAAPVEQTPSPTPNDKVRWAGMVFLFSLPILLLALGLRLWDFSLQSAYMDETSNILSGRLWLEQGRVYANALEWSYGSFLYPILVGWFDQQGGLAAARSLSLIAGLVTVFSTIVMTLGLFKSNLAGWRQSRADLALSSKPMIAALLAGLLVAVLPTAVALSRFSTYDATAAGFFAAGCAAFVWARRVSVQVKKAGSHEWRLSVGLFALSALFLFLAFLTKYVVAMYFPLLCLLVLFTSSMRRKGLFSFVVPLSIACIAYYVTFAQDLTALLKFSGSYTDLRSDNWWGVYVWDRIDLIILALLAYWGLRQAFRDGRSGASILLWGGALALIIFQAVTRADYDYWKHSIYLIIMFAPLAGWLWSDWDWWEEDGEAKPGRIAGWWTKFKNGGGKSLGHSTVEGLDHALGGTAETERPGSYSLVITLAVGLMALGIVWSAGAATKLVSHWPSVAPVADRIEQASTNAKTALVDDTGLLYYLYRKIDTDAIATPFSSNYKGLSGDDAYRQAIADQYYGLVVLDGGDTPAGKHVAELVRPILKASASYKLVFNQALDSTNLPEAHSLEIYRHLSPAEQRDQAEAQAAAPVATPQPTQPTAKAAPTTAAATTAPAQKAATTAPATTAVAVSTTPAAIVAVKYPNGATFDFSKGDEGWGGMAQTGGLQPGVGVAPDEAYKLDGHTSLRFTPQTSGKMYSVGVAQTGKATKVTLYAFIPADKADRDVQVGMYYFDEKWGWHDDGFTGRIVPGRWNEISLSLPADTSLQGFGLKLVGYSGAVYINGVTVAQ